MIASRSDQIIEQVVQVSISTPKNYQNDQISKLTTKVYKTAASFRYQLRRLCTVLSWSVRLSYQLVGIIYVPVRRHEHVSNRSVSLTYQQWPVTYHDDVLAWTRMVKLATKMGQFLLHTMQYTSLASQVVQSF